MYGIIKNIIKQILPKTVLFKNEFVFRRVYYVFFKGNRYQCNLCGAKLRAFIQSGIDSLCPKCGSLSRTRRLWHIVEHEFLSPGADVLDFSPSRSIYRKLKAENIHYRSSDLSGDFIADENYDITNIKASNDSFDLIICYHILEHIADDFLAMKELHRVLRSKGACIIQTPFKHGEIYEDHSITSEEDRKKHFGQEDHVRIYSVKGLTDRLKNAGFFVEIKAFNNPEDNVYGYKSKETVLICRKTPLIE